MFTSRSGRRLLLLVAVSIALLVAGTGAAAACDTCAAPDQEESDYEPFWSNDEFPYDTSENNSFVDIVVEETEAEMEEDFGGDGSDAAAASASAGGASAYASANAEGVTVAGSTTSSDAAVTLGPGGSGDE